jgi:16S rRNA (uracil1498-N3)-methyltransferase
VITVVVAPIEFDGTEVELRGDAYHHLFRVRRLQAGESLRVVDGEGRARRGVVARVDGARAVIAFGAGEPANEAARSVELWVAPPKPDRVAWMVEKATEAGITAIRFVATGRTVREGRSPGAAMLARWHRVALAAVEQCGRARVPEIDGLAPLAARLAAATASARRVVVLDAGGARGAAPLLGAPGEPAELAILVGPEGGWTEAERAEFAASGLPLASLGERALRVETAAVVAAGIALSTGLARADSR